MWGRGGMAGQTCRKPSLRKALSSSENIADGRRVCAVRRSLQGNPANTTSSTITDYTATDTILGKHITVCRVKKASTRFVTRHVSSPLFQRDVQYNIIDYVGVTVSAYCMLRCGVGPESKLYQSLLRSLIHISRGCFCGGFWGKSSRTRHARQQMSSRTSCRSSCGHASFACTFH